jgi:hypothetical protein
LDGNNDLNVLDCSPLVANLLSGACKQMGISIQGITYWWMAFILTNQYSNKLYMNFKYFEVGSIPNFGSFEVGSIPNFWSFEVGSNLIPTLMMLLAW